MIASTEIVGGEMTMHELESTSYGVALWSVASAGSLGLASVLGFVGPDYLAALAGALGLASGMMARRSRRAYVARLIESASRVS